MELKLNRNYLTAEEVGFVGSQLIESEDALSREILRIGLIGQLLIEGFEKEYETCDEYYDIIMASEIDLEKEIKNINAVDNFVSNTIGTDKALKDFVEEIGKLASESMKKLPKELKNFKMEDLVNQLKGALNGN